MTAVVCTRNRGALVARTVASILASAHPDFTLIVVDQSTDDATAQAVAPFLADRRLCYLRTRTKGLGRARNIGLRAASTEVVAFTDDDCEVPAHWLDVMQAVFAEHPRVAVAFCDVDAAPHDPSLGFIPAYHCRANTLLTRIGQKCRARGIGAGLAVRRPMVLDMGGFDEMLGPGAHFPSCDDGDIAVRALLRGYHVYETRDVSVLHSGYRTFAEGRDLSRRDWTAIGAAYAKPLRCGRWDFWSVPAYEFFVMAVLPPWHDLMRLRRPHGATRVLSFLQGFCEGLRHPVDPKTFLFRPLPAEAVPVLAAVR